MVSSNKKKKLLKCTTSLAAIIHKWMRFQFFRVRVGRDRRAAVSCCTQLANDRITHVTTTCTAVFWSRNQSGNETACGGFRHDVIISKNSCTNVICLEFAECILEPVLELSIACCIHTEKREKRSGIKEIPNGSLRRSHRALY